MLAHAGKGWKGAHEERNGGKCLLHSDFYDTKGNSYFLQPSHPYCVNVTGLSGVSTAVPASVFPNVNSSNHTASEPAKDQQGMDLT